MITMADEAIKKPASVKPEDVKEAAKATLLALAGTKSPAIKEPGQVQTRPKAEVIIQAPRAKPEAMKEPVKPLPETKAKPEAPGEAAKPAPEAKPDAPKTETKAEEKKEADPGKEFVDSIMTEMALKGASKKRLIKMLAEQFNFDKQKVMFRLKRALITERYAAVHAEAGH
ncbi:MAG: hypothetical protein J5U17_06880 [Candidatus Methanoperedens sp.]|nr:hypothetical protein [Candidatus Methanoperedens sp.]